MKNGFEDKSWHKSAPEKELLIEKLFLNEEFEIAELRSGSVLGHKGGIWSRGY